MGKYELYVLFLTTRVRYWTVLEFGFESVFNTGDPASLTRLITVITPVVVFMRKPVSY